MTKTTSAGVFQLPNGMWGFRYAFMLDGNHRDADYHIERAPIQTNSLHIEYDWCYLKPFDCIDISTENDSFLCYPKKENVVTKLAFATEIIYEMHAEKNKKSRAR